MTLRDFQPTFSQRSALSALFAWPGLKLGKPTSCSLHATSLCSRQRTETICYCDIKIFCLLRLNSLVTMTWKCYDIDIEPDFEDHSVLVNSLQSPWHGEGNDKHVGLAAYQQLVHGWLTVTWLRSGKIHRPVPRRSSLARFELKVRQDQQTYSNLLYKFTPVTPDQRPHFRSDNMVSKRPINKQRSARHCYHPQVLILILLPHPHHHHRHQHHHHHHHHHHHLLWCMINTNTIIRIIIALWSLSSSEGSTFDFDLHAIENMTKKTCVLEEERDTNITQTPHTMDTRTQPRQLLQTRQVFTTPRYSKSALRMAWNQAWCSPL